MGRADTSPGRRAVGPIEAGETPPYLDKIHRFSQDTPPEADHRVIRRFDGNPKEQPNMHIHKPLRAAGRRRWAP